MVFLRYNKNNWIRQRRRENFQVEKSYLWVIRKCHKMDLSHDWDGWKLALREVTTYDHLQKKNGLMVPFCGVLPHLNCTLSNDSQDMFGGLGGIPGSQANH